MKIFNLKSEIWLPQPRPEVFAFFACPQNLQRLTPPWLQFEILMPADTPMQRGTVLDYRLRLHGIPLQWRSEIAAWEPPTRFIDRQVKGPYSQWIHEHSFADRDGGTLVGDAVEYAVPGGSLVQKLFVAPDLRRIFQYRHDVLCDLFNPERRKPTQSVTCPPRSSAAIWSM